jgi:hypothetical protein
MNYLIINLIFSDQQQKRPFIGSILGSVGWSPKTIASGLAFILGGERIIFSTFFIQISPNFS